MSRTENPQSQSNRIHDLANIQHQLKLVVRLIREGYRFEEAEGEEILRSLERSAAVLEREVARQRAEAQSP